MSIFKDSAIVLKITKQENKNFVYHLMSEKFGKIVAVKKLNSKEKSVDIGYQINYEIESKGKGEINKLKNVKIINEFNYKGKEFKEINEFLKLISIIIKKVGFGIENISINEVVKEVLKYIKDDLEIKLILAQLKIIDILGELNIENKNETISKILNFINKNNFKNILKLSGINEEQKKELQNIL